MSSRPRPAARRRGRAVLLGAAALAGLLAAPRPAAATFNKFVSARALAPRASEIGVAAAYGEVDPDYATAFVLGRVGLFRSLEVGGRLGALSADRPGHDETSVLFGLDAKVQVLRESIDIPFDFAVDVAWTVAFPGGETYSDLAFAGLFGKLVERPFGIPVSFVPYLGAELVFLSGRARPGGEDSAAFGIAGVEFRLASRLTFTPEVKVGDDLVYGAALRYRF